MQQLYFLAGNQFITEMLIPTILVILPHKKKQNYLLRMFLLVLAGEIVSLFVMNTQLAGRQWMNPENVIMNSSIYVCIFPVVSTLLIITTCKTLNWKEIIYCMALCQCMQHCVSSAQICIQGIWVHEFYFSRVASIFAAAFIYGVIYQKILRKVCVDGYYDIKTGFLMIDLMLVIFLAAVISVWAKGIQQQGASRLFYVCQVYDFMCCMFVLWMQVQNKKAQELQKSLDIQEYLSYLRKEQFRQSKETLEYRTHLMHDLAHQFAIALCQEDSCERDRMIAELEDNLLFYEYQVNTKNETLDAVLMERSLFCKANHISWMCIVDGDQLDILDNSDLYVILKNAIDNAVEGVCTLEDELARIIDIRVFLQNGCLVIQIENDFNGELQFKDGLPLTTKTASEFHGFGLTTMKQIIEKYDGYMTVNADKQRFSLQMIIPKHKRKEL